MTKRNRYISATDAESQITRAYRAINTQSDTRNKYLKARYKKRILLLSCEDSSNPDYSFMSLWYFWPSDFNYAYCVFDLRGKCISFNERGAAFVIPSLFEVVVE